MSEPNKSDIHVLIVDDEPDVAEIFSHWLNKQYETDIVTNGKDALDFLEEHSDVDVVFLDRRMPAMTGDEVLEEIRKQDYDCMIAMITAIDPDINIVDMSFDDYITKPATQEDLFDAVESLTARQNYSDKLDEYYTLLAKQAALQEQFSDNHLQDMEKFTELQDRLTTLRSELDSEIDFSEHDTFVSALKDATKKLS